MAARMSSTFSTDSPLNKDGESGVTGIAPRVRQNYTKAIIIGLVCGVLIGGAIGVGVGFAVRRARSS